MKLAEGAIFLGLATGLHLAVFAIAPGGGPAASGEGGQAQVSLAAMPEQVQSLVAAWETAPEAAQDIAQPDVNAGDVAPVVADAAPDPARRAALPPPIAPQSPQDQSLAPMADPGLPLPPAPTAPEPVSEAMGLPPAPPPLVNDKLPTQALAMMAAPQASPYAPSIDTSTAEPQPVAAPATSPRPVARPAPKPKPATKPAPQKNATKPKAKPSAPQPAQKATGAGKTATASAGTAKTAASGPSKAERQNAMAKWGGQIRSRIARAQRYPGGTRAQGTVKLRITVSRGGKLMAATITGSSGDAALDKAALKAVRAARLPAAPKALNNASYDFNLPLKFSR
ncbi:TonB family protein [Pseudoprimorskyibacter insulae]|uniref:TonB C-terminal domain-containing protein n=1 Tax=Pseudoprimorskyibacter insulae TaxID=1695997 RepID=A0A2R8AR67_9RHOB|nr:TonB family protein [Pseudoprimorskyibacter insulae]SPF78367.1 hypothetical protein PRI8871_00966 [Pseudoprimorskyibacter insulae]